MEYSRGPHRGKHRLPKKTAQPGLAAPLQSILVNIAQRTNIVSRQDRADDQNQHYNHLEHVLHVVFHLSESWPSRRLPLPALSHQAAQGLGSG